MACKLYAGLPNLTQAEANQAAAAWIPAQFSDLTEAIKASRRLDQATHLVNVAWIIECDDGQRLERHDIVQRYPFSR